MSDLTFEPRDATRCGAGDTDDRLELLDARVATVGSQLTIRRALPARGRRMIGAWCFLDHFGPVAFEQRRDGMWVGQHPHIGLQTVTWLLDGQVLHRDSIGSKQTIRPGGLNVMTAGSGIAHTEESPADHDGRLHGVQLWLALPEAHAEVDASFEHVEALPTYEDDGVRATLFVGSGLEADSPATIYSPLVGADVRIESAGQHLFPLDPAFEHGVVVCDGELSVSGTRFGVGVLGYLGPGRRSLSIETDGPARFVLVGGEPFPEEILLWWNFVGRSDEEIRGALEDWKRGDRFDDVPGFEGGRLKAPPLEGRLR